MVMKVVNGIGKIRFLVEGDHVLGREDKLFRSESTALRYERRLAMKKAKTKWKKVEEV